MSWADLTFRTPPSAVSLADGTGAALSPAAGELDAAAARLAAVAGALPNALNPAAGSAAGASELRAGLGALTAAGGAFLCVHPYVHPVGDRRGDAAYLTPPDAVKRVAAKLADDVDPAPGISGAGASGMVAVLLCGTNHAGFADTLAAFNAVFPVTALRLAERRARSLAALEREKFLRPVAPPEPRWRTGDLRRHPAGARADRNLGERIAAAEGYRAAAVRPGAELACVMARKKARLAAAEQAWEAFAAEFSGGAGMGLYMTGDAGSIRRGLLEAGGPGPEYPLCAVACWMGEPERLKFLREMIGL